MTKEEAGAGGDKSEIRYDRQLRLWGSDGQAALTAAQVCLVGATGTGTEALKSLVLPGIGGFCIVDDAVVSEEDLGINFFVTEADLGKPRAEVTATYLQELNPAVRGRGTVLDLRWAAEEEGRLEFLTSFSLVIVGGVGGDRLRESVSRLLWAKGIPLLVARSYGLLGYLRLSTPSHQVVQTHPDNPAPDLRVSCPWPQLRKMVDEIDLPSLTHEKHSHVPYGILLVKAVDAWRVKKGSAEASPRSYANKKEVKAILESMRMPDDKGRLDEENFAEAIAAVNRALAPQSVPSQVRELLDLAEERIKVEPQSKFWILCTALRRFVQTRGELPLSGAVPDMASDSDSYLRLLEVYKSRAAEDAALVRELARETAELAGSGAELSEAEVSKFCRCASSLWALRTPTSLAEEVAGGPSRDRLAAALESAPSAAAWYIGLRAVDRFQAEKDRYPGTNGIPVELDGKDLRARVEALAAAAGLEAEVVYSIAIRGPTGSQWSWTGRISGLELRPWRLQLA